MNDYTVCVDDTAPAATPYYIRALVNGIYTELGLFTDVGKALDTAKQQSRNFSNGRRANAE